MHKRLTFKNFNIADWFSFYRIAISPILVWLLLIDKREPFTWLLSISYATDAIDGYLARRLKISSPRGSQLDSMGDQVTFVIGVIGVLVFDHTFILDHYMWLLLGFGLYSLQMLLAWRKYSKATAFHTYLAKLSAVVQSLFILTALFYQPLEWMFFSMLFIGVLETLEEIVLIFIFDSWQSDIKGIYWVLKSKR